MCQRLTQAMVLVQRVDPAAQLPRYAKPGDAGFDLATVEGACLRPGGKVLLDTGLAFELPAGTEMQIRPRSSTNWKTPLIVKLGTIDAGYRGTVKIVLELPAWAHEPFWVEPGAAYAQGVIAPVVRAQFVGAASLSETERGGGGFGSTTPPPQPYTT